MDEINLIPPLKQKFQEECDHVHAVMPCENEHMLQCAWRQNNCDMSESASVNSTHVVGIDKVRIHKGPLTDFFAITE